MPKRFPLSLDDSGNTQQLQRSDRLDPERTKLASQEEFEVLRTNFRLLCRCLLIEGFDLPDELVRESELL